MTDTPSLPPDHAFLSKFSLAGRVALITGSARGLGWEIAHAMAACGAHVILNGRQPGPTQAAAQRLRDAGLQASALVFDVGDSQATEAAFAMLDAQHGRLDILVNNVGARVRKPLSAFTAQEIRALIDTDLVAAILLSKLAAERMAAQGYGRLIAITSVAGEIARPGDAVYPAAKQGLTGLMRALAVEYAPQGITSNAIAPGTFATETNAAMMADPQVHARLAARNPTGRWGQPGEIAGAAVFLASPAASYINGQVLAVDGGLSILF
ncbi:SDR family oxidoreductase [Bordetella trematum]|uniref:SDR family oxidoreductase n=1 Tax=Bordetella trematum TaxID=123899 RepID=UPI0039898145